MEDYEIIIGDKNLMNYVFAVNVVFGKSNKVVLKTTEKYSEKMLQLIHIVTKLGIEQVSQDVKDEVLTVGENNEKKKCSVYVVTLAKVPAISGD